MNKGDLAQERILLFSVSGRLKRLLKAAASHSTGSLGPTCRMSCSLGKQVHSANACQPLGSAACNQHSSITPPDCGSALVGRLAGAQKSALAAALQGLTLEEPSGMPSSDVPAELPHAESSQPHAITEVLPRFLTPATPASPALAADSSAADAPRPSLTSSSPLATAGSPSRGVALEAQSQRSPAVEGAPGADASPSASKASHAKEQTLSRQSDQLKGSHEETQAVHGNIAGLTTSTEFFGTLNVS